MADNGYNARPDRIEQIQARNVELVAANWDVIKANTERITRMSERQERADARIDARPERADERQERIDERLERLAEMQERTQHHLDILHQEARFLFASVQGDVAQPHRPAHAEESPTHPGSARE